MKKKKKNLGATWLRNTILIGRCGVVILKNEKNDI